MYAFSGIIVFTYDDALNTQKDIFYMLKIHKRYPENVNSTKY